MASKNARSARKGKAVEHLIAATCVLATRAELNALTALVDDEGVDVGFKRRNGTRTLDIQIKSRFSDEDGSKKLREDGSFVSDVRGATFTARDDLYLIYAAVNAELAQIETVWIVPSHVLNEYGIRLTIKGQEVIRFQASAKETSEDKWREYRMSTSDMPNHLLEILESLEPDVDLNEDALEEGETEDLDPDSGEGT